MSSAAPSGYSPREWIGSGEYPWPPTLGLADGERVTACFSVNSVAVGRTRANAPFLKLQLADSHGVIEARMWNDVEAVADHVHTGSYVGVRGCLETYQDQRQLKVEELALLRIELDDLMLFLPRSARPADRMEAELGALINSISDAPLRQLVEHVLGAGTETGHAFRMAPAAKQNHHAYLGGLIEHTLSVASVCDMLARHYGAAVDRDLLLAGALLHDIGKIREIGARGGFPYTDEGKLLGHILIGLQIVADAASAVPELGQQRLLLLQHLIASHQGRYEWQSPREPRILEGLVLHYADDLDAKMNQAGNLLDGVAAGWTAYDRSLARDFLRHRAPEQPGAGATGPAALSPPIAAPPARAPRRSKPAAPAAGEIARGAEPPPPTDAQAEHPAGGADDPAERTDTPPPNEPPHLETLDLFES
jgi:3'-5' exoribonuclease